MRLVHGCTLIPYFDEVGDNKLGLFLRKTGYCHRNASFSSSITFTYNLTSLLLHVASVCFLFLFLCLFQNSGYLLPEQLMTIVASPGLFNLGLKFPEFSCEV